MSHGSRRAFSPLFLCLAGALALATWVRAASPPTLRVGVFDGHGVAATCLVETVEALKIDPDIRPEPVSAADIAAGALDHLDAIVFPGGGGAREGADLGDAGAARVRDFVLRRGGGAVGLCAGAYLLSDTPGYACLRLFPARAIDLEHDERGHGLVAYKPAPEGLDLFPELRGFGGGRVYYYEGPILVPAGKGPQEYTVLATMESDVHLEHDAPAGMTPGRPLFASAERGAGRIFISVGHPEATPGLRWIVPRAVRWAARRPSVSYSCAVVRPGLLGEDILFDKTLSEEESALHERLLYGDGPMRCAAVARLAAMRSWDGAAWIRGMVRNAEPSVRVCAARVLLALEWTAAIPDLRGAVGAEKDAVVRADLSSCLSGLEAMTPAAAGRCGHGSRRAMAITLDDLPLVNAGADDPGKRLELTKSLVAALKGAGVPATGFVIGKAAQAPDGAALLKVWSDAGLELGNHSQTHPSVHQTDLKAYEADILLGDAALRAMLAGRGQAPRYFRHPFLQTGRDEATKREVPAFLAQHGYAVAPVTVDTSDWVFAKAYASARMEGAGDRAERVKSAYLVYMASKLDYWERQSEQLLGYEVRQILLIHASALNADSMDDLLAMMVGRGYAFVSLGDALKDPAYAMPDGYFGGGGISWLHRWALALGGKAALLPGEPRCPEWVMKAAGVESE